MNILVTVGTTKFNSLIAAVDNSDWLSKHEVLVQCADGAKSAKYASTVFIDDIASAYQRADLIITHAGAGSVFRMLEAGHCILVIPNLERKDNHQLEIARFVDEAGYGLVCSNLEQLDATLEKLLFFRPATYEKSEFHAAKEIVDWISELYH